MPKPKAAGGGTAAAAKAAARQQQAPPPQAVQQQRLRPVYVALDNHNFTKVLKLTTAEPICHWDLTKALRVIALDRSGRKREALGLLRDVLGHGCYDELEDRILQMDVGLPPSTSTSTSTSVGGTGAGGGGGAGAGGKSKGGKKGKSKKGGSAASSSSSATGGGTKSILRSETNAAAAHAHAVDYVDLLDVPPWKRRMTRQKDKAESSLKDENNKANIIVDDVSCTLCIVSLLCFGPASMPALIFPDSTYLKLSAHCNCLSPTSTSFESYRWCWQR